MAFKIIILYVYGQIIFKGDFLKHKFKILPTHSLIENDEYFYRHPEMYRSHVDNDVFNSNKIVDEKIEENKTNIKKNK